MVNRTTRAATVRYGGLPVSRSVLAGVRAYDGTRHSFASQLVNKGKSLEIIGEILGHSDIRTTRRYAHVHLDAMRMAMEE